MKDGKINPMFGRQPGYLKQKYGIDINELIDMYPFKMEYLDELNEQKKI